MGIKGTILFLVMFNIQMNILVSGEPINCTSYRDIARFDRSCKPDGYFPLLSDDVVTKDLLLQTIGEFCSNTGIRRPYHRCVITLLDECPFSCSDLVDDILNKMKMFCSDKSAALWLQRALRNGYSFNAGCTEVSEEAARDCRIEFNIDDDMVGSDISLEKALQDIPQMMSDMFRCMREKLPTMETEQRCGSSWQDVLLEYLLRVSSKGGLFETLPYADILELPDMKNNS